MNYPIKVYKRNYREDANTKSFIDSFPEWMNITVNPADPMRRFIGSTIGTDRSATLSDVATIDRYQDIMAVGGDEIPDWVYVAPLTSTVTPSGKIPTEDSTELKIGSSTPAVILSDIMSYSTTYATRIKRKDVIPFVSGNSDYVALTYGKNASGDYVYAALQSGIGFSGIQEFDQDLNVVSNHGNGVFIHSFDVDGYDEIHYTESTDYNYSYCQTNDLPVLDDIVITFESGQVTAKDARQITLVDYLTITNAEYINNSGQLDTIIEGITIDESGIIRIPESTTISNGYNISPFVSGWYESENTTWDSSLPIDGDLTEKSDYTTNVWPLSNTYAKGFDYREYNKILGIPYGVILTSGDIIVSGTMFGITATEVTIQSGALGDITATVDADFDSIDTGWRYLVFRESGDPFALAVESGRRLMFSGSSWLDYEPQDNDTIAARMEKYRDWSYGASGWEHEAAYRIVTYETDQLFDVNSSWLQMWPNHDSSGNFYEYQTLDWSMSKRSPWNNAGIEKEEHTITVSAEKISGSSDEVYVGIWDYTEESWISITSNEVSADYIQITSGVLLTDTSGTFSVSATEPKPNTIGVRIFAKEGEDPGPVKIRTIKLGPEVRPNYPSKWNEPDQEIYCGILGALTVSYYYKQMEEATSFVFPSRNGSVYNIYNDPIVAYKPGNQRELFANIVTSVDSHELEYAAAIDPLDLRPSASTSGELGTSGTLVTHYRDYEKFEISNPESGSYIYIDKPHYSGVTIDESGVIFSFYDKDDPYFFDEDRQILDSGYTIDGDTVYLNPIPYLSGYADSIYVYVQYSAWCESHARSFQTVASESALVSGSIIEGIFYSGNSEGYSTYQQSVTNNIYNDIYRMVNNTVIPYTMLPFHPEFDYVDGIIRSGTIESRRIYTDDYPTAILYNESDSEIINIRSSDQVAEVYDIVPNEPKRRIPLNMRTGADAITTTSVANSGSLQNFIDYRLRTDVKIVGADVFHDFIYALDNDSGDCTIWRFPIYEPGYLLDSQVTRSGEIPVVTYKYESFEVSGNYLDIAITENADIAFLTASGIELYDQLFDYASVDFDNSAVFFLEDPEESGQIILNGDFSKELRLWDTVGDVAVSGTGHHSNNALFMSDGSLMSTTYNTTISGGESIYGSLYAIPYDSGGDLEIIVSGIEYSSGTIVNSGIVMSGLDEYAESGPNLYTVKTWTNISGGDYTTDAAADSIAFTISASGSGYISDIVIGTQNTFVSSPTNYWNNFDEFGLFMSLERLPMETNSEFLERMINQGTNPPGVTRQGIINGISSETGLTQYNVTDNTFFYLSGQPQVWLHPDEPSSSDLADVQVTVNGETWGRVYDPVGDWVNSGEHPSGTQYYDTLGNCAVSSGWVLWRDDEGNYTQTLQVIGAPDLATIKVSYYVLIDDETIQVTDGTDLTTDTNWIVRAPTSGEYTVRTYNDSGTTADIVGGNDEVLLGMLDEVREKAPIEFGKLKYDKNYWPKTTGSLNGLYILFDADIED